MEVMEQHSIVASLGLVSQAGKDDPIKALLGAQYEPTAQGHLGTK